MGEREEVGVRGGERGRGSDLTETRALALKLAVVRCLNTAIAGASKSQKKTKR